MLEAVRRSPAVEQVLLASSDKAYGVQPRLPYDETMPLLAEEPYDASKACAELLARTYRASYGTPVAITRCANLYGPGDRNWRRLVPGTLRSVLRGEPPVIRSDGSLVRDYLYVKDAVSAYLRLAEAMAADPALAGEAFNVSAELPLTVTEMVRRVQDAAGTSFEPVIVDDAVGEIPEQHLSARKAREVLGWEPAYSLEQGLAETVEHYRDLLAGQQSLGGRSPPRSAQDCSSQARRSGSGSNALPPLYQPGAVHSSKCRWQPLARPVAPTKPIGWPVLTRSPSSTSAASRRCM